MAWLRSTITSPWRIGRGVVLLIALGWWFWPPTAERAYQRLLSATKHVHSDDAERWLQYRREQFVRHPDAVPFLMHLIDEPCRRVGWARMPFVLHLLPSCGDKARQALKNRLLELEQLDSQDDRDKLRELVVVSALVAEFENWSQLPRWIELASELDVDYDCAFHVVFLALERMSMRFGDDVPEFWDFESGKPGEIRFSEEFQEWANALANKHRKK
jgi:hypothetical protein